MSGLWDAAREALGGLLALAGLLAIVGGLLGVLRFPDFYTRLHAANVTNGLGALLVLIGLAVLANDWSVAIRILLLALLMSALAPLWVHLAGSAAHAGGLTPLTGVYTAPRPGARR